MSVPNKSARVSKSGAVDLGRPSIRTQEYGPTVSPKRIRNSFRGWPFVLKRLEQLRIKHLSILLKELQEADRVNLPNAQALEISELEAQALDLAIIDIGRHLPTPLTALEKLQKGVLTRDEMSKLKNDTKVINQT